MVCVVVLCVWWYCGDGVWCMWWCLCVVVLCVMVECGGRPDQTKDYSVSFP